jgi:asparagine synthase (glutamine-hydrolysing)
MCGIYGFILHEPNDQLLQRANQLQAHRGPDGAGYMTTKVGNYYVGLAHQRLSIIDLTEAAAQPMASNSGEEIISYNGEIYNYKELAAEEKLSSSAGDTRVLIELLSKYSVHACEKLNGMWAFAFIDKNNRSLTLSRDRFGEKPLYYFQRSEELYFSSELKTLMALVPVKFDLNYQVIGEFLHQGLTNFTEESILKGVSQVPPGSNLTYNLSGPLKKKVSNYWNPSSATNLNISMDAAISEVREVFSDSVRLRLRSDVPIAILLSGGIDSSAIASCMAEQVGPDSVQTLSAVSRKPSMDERRHIKLVNSHLGVKSNLVCVDPSPDEALELMQAAVHHNDMPIADFSNVAHLLLMREAASMGTKVVLSGQGADELFCGYRKYVGFYAQQLLRDRKILKLSKMLLTFLLRGTVLNQFRFSEAKRYLTTNKEVSGFLGEKMRAFLPVPMGLQKGMRLVDRQIYDLQKTSVPSLTHYEDRMSMANGVEIRLPFLDQRLVELALKLPEKFKLKSGWTKYVLRKAIEDKLPSDITWRKDKQGFLNPQAQWLKNEWKPIVKNHIAKDSIICASGIVDHIKLNDCFNEFCKSKNVWYREIFAPFSLEIWLRENSKKLNL